MKPIVQCFSDCVQMSRIRLMKYLCARFGVQYLGKRQEQECESLQLSELEMKVCFRAYFA